MKRMRTAKAKVSSFFIDCPYCDEAIVHPATGYIGWPIFEAHPKSVTCEDCGKTVKVPERVISAFIAREKE